MSEELDALFVATADREAFALCLAMGTLQAIRSGTWPAEAGIWTIARPVFRESLETIGMSEETIKVFRGADELSALEELAGTAVLHERLDRDIATLQNRLGALPNRAWYARWSQTPANSVQAD